MENLLNEISSLNLDERAKIKERLSDQLSKIEIISNLEVKPSEAIPESESESESDYQSDQTSDDSNDDFRVIARGPFRPGHTNVSPRPYTNPRQQSTVPNNLERVQPELTYNIPAAVTSNAPPFTLTIPQGTFNAPPFPLTIPEVTSNAPPFTLTIPEVTSNAPLFTLTIPVVTSNAPPFTLTIPEVTSNAPPFTLTIPVVTSNAPPFTLTVPEVISNAPPFPLTIPEVTSNAPPLTLTIPSTEERNGSSIIYYDLPNELPSEYFDDLNLNDSIPNDNGNDLLDLLIEQDLGLDNETSSFVESLFDSSSLIVSNDQAIVSGNIILENASQSSSSAYPKISPSSSVKVNERVDRSNTIKIIDRKTGPRNKYLKDVGTSKKNAFRKEIGKWSVKGLETVTGNPFTILHFLIESGKNHFAIYFLDILEKWFDKNPKPKCLETIDGVECFVNARNDVGETALYVATKYNRHDVVAYLIDKRDADVQLADYVNGDTPFHVACRSGDNYLQVLEVYLEFKTKFNWEVVNGIGGTALHVAVRYHRQNGLDNAKIVNRLLRALFRLNIQDGDGFTPVHLAVEKGSLDLLEIMCLYGRHLKEALKMKDNRCPGRTPLDLANDLNDLDLRKATRKMLYLESIEIVLT